jgi:uncharacterized OB-fold protein
MPECFMAMKCPRCGTLDVGPSSICRVCGAEPMGKTPVAGTGRLVSWTVIRRAPTRFETQAPYVVVVVDLDCGLRVTGRCTKEVEALSTGATVRCTGSNDETSFFDLAGECRS